MCGEPVPINLYADALQVKIVMQRLPGPIRGTILVSHQPAKTAKAQRGQKETHEGAAALVQYKSGRGMQSRTARCYCRGPPGCCHSKDSAGARQGRSSTAEGGGGGDQLASPSEGPINAGPIV